ncbi:hypothetical protein [Bosea minatitlanensis]|uniref:Uncharacterized protein n=1 Tax=Bosea minatitlanensis TaxID=128782 RepID=A0ABW0F0L5_9HYPH|nr:hypothetical protein [Bosea minatitlanensis]MCT4492755.1 hypothetical protein [Bosea minatitlanensis]
MASELTIGQQMVARRGKERPGIVFFIQESMTICQRHAPDVLEGLGAARMADADVPGAGLPASDAIIANTVDRRLHLRPRDVAAAEALLRYEL